MACNREAPPQDDPSAGYESAAEGFMSVRSDAGAAVVALWAQSLPSGASVIDIGAGHGAPLTPPLLNAGIKVWALEPSPRLARAHRAEFPTIPVACEAVPESFFFGRTFDAALMVGVIFLLPGTVQQTVFPRIAAAVRPCGSLLFSAPREMGTWDDVLTGRTCCSLGQQGYTSMLRAAGFRLVAEHDDDGGNHFYEAQRLG